MVEKGLTDVRRSRASLPQVPAVPRPELSKLTDASITHDRARSLRLVQAIFAGIAGLCLVLAVGFHLGLLFDGLGTEERRQIAYGFLFTAASDVAMIFVWELLFRTSPER